MSSFSENISVNFPQNKHVEIQIKTTSRGHIMITTHYLIEYVTQSEEKETIISLPIDKARELMSILGKAIQEIE